MVCYYSNYELTTELCSVYCSPLSPILFKTATPKLVFICLLNMAMMNGSLGVTTEPSALHSLNDCKGLTTSACETMTSY